MLHHTAMVLGLNPAASLTVSHTLRTSLHSKVPLAYNKTKTCVTCFISTEKTCSVTKTKKWGKGQKSHTDIFTFNRLVHTHKQAALLKKNVFTKQQVFLSRQKSITGINVKVGYNNKSNSSIFRN